MQTIQNLKRSAEFTADASMKRPCKTFSEAIVGMDAFLSGEGETPEGMRAFLSANKLGSLADSFIQKGAMGLFFLHIDENGAKELGVPQWFIPHLMACIEALLERHVEISEEPQAAEEAVEEQTGLPGFMSPITRSGSLDFANTEALPPMVLPPSEPVPAMDFQPQFVQSPPQFVSQPPQFVSSPIPQVRVAPPPLHGHSPVIMQNQMFQPQAAVFQQFPVAQAPVQVKQQPLLPLPQSPQQQQPLSPGAKAAASVKVLDTMKLEKAPVTQFKMAKSKAVVVQDTMIGGGAKRTVKPVRKRVMKKMPQRVLQSRLREFKFLHDGITYMISCFEKESIRDMKEKIREAVPELAMNHFALIADGRPLKNADICGVVQRHETIVARKTQESTGEPLSDEAKRANYLERQSRQVWVPDCDPRCSEKLLMDHFNKVLQSKEAVVCVKKNGAYCHVEFSEPKWAKTILMTEFQDVTLPRGDVVRITTKKQEGIGAKGYAEQQAQKHLKKAQKLMADALGWNGAHGSQW